MLKMMIQICGKQSCWIVGTFVGPDALMLTLCPPLLGFAHLCPHLLTYSLPGEGSPNQKAVLSDGYVSDISV
jgi:hypothetical protein